MLRLSVGREGIGRKTREKDGDRGTARGWGKRGDGERETDRHTETGSERQREYARLIHLGHCP